MNIIIVEDLTKIYETGMKKGGITALDSVSLSVGQGEIFGLLGPNGAGKTTLFKILLGITQITSGTASVGALPPSNPDSRRKIGYLPENHRFPEYLTGVGLLELSGRLHGMTSGAISERVNGLLHLVGMDRWGAYKIRKYSKGMLQRIGLAQALISDPEILLLDEPTDGVDPVGKTEIRDVLRKMREEGKSIILNSHLLSEVEAAADRVAILSHGKIAKIGSVDELTSRKSQFEIEAQFGDRLIDIPEELGRRLSLSTNRMTVELKEEKNINDIIDMLRLKRIELRAVRPIKISLEQFFIETVSDKESTQV